MNTSAIRNTYKSGFTIVELLVVLAVIGVLLGMLMPATRGVREGARRTSCMNNLRHIGLAIHNFESAHLRMPAVMGDSELIALSNAHDDYRFSAYILLADYLEQTEENHTFRSRGFESLLKTLERSSKHDVHRS